MSKTDYSQSKEILAARVSMPLEWKIDLTIERLKEWHDGYISLSGGLGSRVLLDIANKGGWQTKKPSVFIDTGLEHPGVRAIGIKYSDYVLRPKLMFNEVLIKYGYPVISKAQSMAIRKLTTQNLSEKYRNKLLYGDEKGTTGKLSSKWHYLLNTDFKISEQCCDVMKKRPAHKFEDESGLHPVTAEMVEESVNRKVVYLKNGCNMWNLERPKSTPMAFWTQQDLLEYVVKEKIDYAPEYGEIKQDYLGRYYTTKEQRTGCAFCLFGCHLEKQPNRIQRLKDMDEKRYNYCVGGGEYNDKGIWIPNKKGLGLGHVMDVLGVEHRPCGSIKVEESGQLRIV